VLERFALATRWRQGFSIRIAVALAFADASIAVLALPQIIGEFDTTIQQVTWVIMAYNLGLIVAVVPIVFAARRVPSGPALLAGLAVFGFASIGCGLAESFGWLVALRCVQGVGGALLLCASVPLLAGIARPGESPVAGWAAAAAFGAAVGPAAGGLLTQVFNWRAIFLAQAPAAAVALTAVRGSAAGAIRDPAGGRAAPVDLTPDTANAALGLYSAGLIGALFMVVILLIDVWRLEPLAAALVVSAIPLATLVVERAVRGSPLELGIAGALLLAAGLAAISLIPHQQVALVVAALALCGAGLGLAFPALTTVALSGRGSAIVRAARTVAARDAGLVVGLLVLTPVFVHDLNDAPGRAVPAVTREVVGAPLPGPVKAQLGDELLKAYGQTPRGRLPNLDPAFERVRATTSSSSAGQLNALEKRIDSTIERAVTRSFRRTLLYSALFALAAIPVLAIMSKTRAPRRRRAARRGAS
jgi:MFS family permease